jgi:hypothetical protein
MKLDQHTVTVTIPIADYQELMAAKKLNNDRFVDMRDRMIKHLEELRVPGHLSPWEFLADIIKALKQTV